MVPAPVVKPKIDVIPTAKYRTVGPPMAEQNALASIDPNAQPPALINYLGAYVPWVAFQKSFTGKEIFAWVETEAGWDVIAKAPKGTWVREFVFVPSNGNLIANKIEPNGLASRANFGPVAAGYKYIWLYAQNPGAYISSYETGGKKSNNVTLIAS